MTKTRGHKMLQAALTSKRPKPKPKPFTKKVAQKMLLGPRKERIAAIVQGLRKRTTLPDELIKHIIKFY